MKHIFPRDNSNFKSYHIHIITEKLFPSMSQHTNVTKITRFYATFPGITTSKKVAYHSPLLLLHNPEFRYENLFAQWTSIWKVDSLQQQNNFKFLEITQAVQHDWIAQDYHEKESPLMLHPLFFPLFFQRPTYRPRDMSNCTKSVFSFSFAVHVIAPHQSEILSFSLPRHVQRVWMGFSV